MTGVMKMAPTDAIDACMDILPFPLLIEKILFRATSRLATLPKSHPLKQHIRRAAARYISHHRSPAHEMLHAFRTHPIDVETISPCMHGPKWAPSFPVWVPTSKEATLEEMTSIFSEVIVYLDRSGLNRKIGAAKVLYKGKTE